MVVTELGIEIVCNPLQLLKTFSPIDVIELGISNDVRFSQLAKAPSPINETELGIEIVFNSTQPKNAFFPIDVIELGKITEVSFLHDLKAPSAMLITKYSSLFHTTDCGIVTKPV